MIAFLKEIFAGMEEESFEAECVPDNDGESYVYTIKLSDNAVGFLKTHNDHECTASSEDGCSFCYKLQLLGLLPDADPKEE